MQQDAHTASRHLTLTWMGLVTGVVMIAAVMYWLPFTATGHFPGGALWWLAIALPVGPALVLRQRMRALEQAAHRDPAKVGEWRVACMLCWSVADMPVMLGAPLGMVSGQQELILGGLVVSIALLLVSRPDSSRHV